MQRLIQKGVLLIAMLGLVQGSFSQAFAQDIGSITGRVVDAASGQPLPGDAPPFAIVELVRCEDDDCFSFNYVSGQSADNEGRFLFDRDFSDELISVGLYKIFAYADVYDNAETAPFAVGADEDFDIGDIPLTRPPAIGSITGRVVDAASGQPLPGETPPFAYVNLDLCEDVDCFFTNTVSIVSTDNEGRFLFDRDFSGQLLPVGIYKITAFAEEFESAETTPFAVGEGENKDVGDILLEPPLISFSDIETCDELLPQGGTCRYSVKINNNTSEPLQGLAWSLVDGFGLGSSLDFTSFEASASSSRISQYVRRQRVFLGAFSNDDFGFQFDVPSFVRDGAGFCTRLFFGLEPDPLVNTIREGFLFCINKGEAGFQVMSESESQELLRSFSGKNKKTKHGSITARKR